MEALFGVNWQYYAVMAAVTHLTFGNGWAVQHDLWHHINPRKVPRFLFAGYMLHMVHHGDSDNEAKATLPAWVKHLLFIWSVRLSCAVFGIIGAAAHVAIIEEPVRFLLVWTAMTVSAFLGIRSYIWRYKVGHRMSHAGTWESRWNFLWLKRHMVHHQKGNARKYTGITWYYELAVWLMARTGLRRAILDALETFATGQLAQGATNSWSWSPEEVRESGPTAITAKSRAANA